MTDWTADVKTHLYNPDGLSLGGVAAHRGASGAHEDVTTKNTAVALGRPRFERFPWGPAFVAAAVIAAALAYLPGRSSIPPLVDSDYCYLLTAADRLYDGAGLTTTPPVAPNQPWQWQSDWAFLTKWPAGFPLMVFALRAALDVSSLEACRWISTIAVALALVGWFVWIRRNAPRGLSGVLLAGVGAGTAVSTASLLNPSSDAILVAVVPYLLLATIRGVERCGDDGSRRGVAIIALTGLAAGFLFWIRYAGVFLPAAIAIYLVAEHLVRRRLGVRPVVWFLACAAVPIGVLLGINRAYGAEDSLQSQLNLGQSVGASFSFGLVEAAWQRFTAFRFYDYHALSRVLLTWYPIGLVGVALCLRPIRRGLVRFLTSPGVLISAITVGVLLAMLIVATALFGDKYAYVTLDRYYAPVKPLYFVLFVAPLLWIPRRLIRAAACVVLIVACSWIVQQDWSRPYARWLAADRPTTPYGQWAYSFGSDAGAVYRWLDEQQADDLIVVSNFHEYVALETGIPAITIPKDRDTLDRWIERISAARRTSRPRVLFVLDTTCRWRDYWLPRPAEIIDTFRLTPCDEIAAGNGAVVLEYVSADKNRTATMKERPIHPDT